VDKSPVKKFEPNCTEQSEKSPLSTFEFKMNIATHPRPNLEKNPIVRLTADDQNNFVKAMQSCENAGDVVPSCPILSKKF